jgi:hypothetical protein
MGIVGMMVYPMVGPRGVERPAETARIAAKAIDDRWPPPLPKADRLVAPRLTDARPWGPTVALQLQPEGSAKPTPLPIIEQAIERKAEDEEAERAVREYRDQARDVCARHGMRRHYFHRRHHLSWRCVGRGR